MTAQVSAEAYPVLGDTGVTTVVAVNLTDGSTSWKFLITPEIAQDLAAQLLLTATLIEPDLA